MFPLKNCTALASGEQTRRLSYGCSLSLNIEGKNNVSLTANFDQFHQIVELPMNVAAH